MGYDSQGLPARLRLPSVVCSLRQKPLPWGLGFRVLSPKLREVLDFRSSAGTREQRRRLLNSLTDNVTLVGHDFRELRIWASCGGFGGAFSLISACDSLVSGQSPPRHPICKGPATGCISGDDAIFLFYTLHPAQRAQNCT